jgi:adenylyltransferase/sulfurtransferase
MRYYVDNQHEIAIPAASVAELVDGILARYPVLRPHLFDAQGNLRRHFNIFVNGANIRDLNGMDTPLTDGDKVIVMASAAGG